MVTYGRTAGITLMTFMLVTGCGEKNLHLGKWRTTKSTHEYVILTESDARSLGETEFAPGPFPTSNKQGWIMVKEMGQSPKIIKSAQRPYSVAVVESGFSFLQSTKLTENANSLDDIEWGWRIVVANRSKRGVHAYGGYCLLDKDGFPLTTAGVNFDNDESGTYIAAGEQVTLQGRSHWRVNASSKPYPPSRVQGGDYKLFLRHDIFEQLSDEQKTSH